MSERVQAATVCVGCVVLCLALVWLTVFQGATITIDEGLSPVEEAWIAVRLVIIVATGVLAILAFVAACFAFSAAVESKVGMPTKLTKEMHEKLDAAIKSDHPRAAQDLWDELVKSRPIT
jgi:hypothetical protein